MLKKIGKAIVALIASIGVTGLLFIIVLAFVGTFILGIRNMKNTNQLHYGVTNLEEREAQEIDHSVKIHYERTANTGFYQKFSNGLDYKNTPWESFSDKFTDKMKLLFDFNDKYIHDANLNKVVDLKQAGAFEALGDAENYYRDYQGREMTYSSLSSSLLSTFDEAFFKQNTIGEPDIIFPEKQAKPLHFIDDYIRIDADGNRIYNIIERDEDGQVIPFDFSNTKIVDFEFDEVNETNYYKEYGDGHEGYPISLKLSETTVNNKYNNDTNPVEMIEYDVDKSGEPIVPSGVRNPRKYPQRVPITDEYGNVTAKSITKYNYQEKMNKIPIFTIDEEKEMEEQATEMSAYDPHSYSMNYNYLKQQKTNEKLDGIEDIDWEWEYDYRYKNLGEIQNDGSLKYNAVPEDFRFHYINGELVDMTEQDGSYEFKNSQYAWDTDKEKMVSKFYREEIPMEIKSVADYGLGVIFSYIPAKTVSFKQALSIDEERDPNKVQEYITQNIHPSFKEARDGFYPKIIEDEHEELREYAYNTEEIEYFYDIFKEDMGTIQNIVDEDSIDKNGNFIGKGAYTDQEINKKIQVKSPTVESSGLLTFFTQLNNKEQITKPEKYYLYWYDKINENRENLEFWAPGLLSLKDKIGKGNFTDKGVDAEIDTNKLYSKLGHNINLDNKIEEVQKKGTWDYTNPSMTEQIFLIEMATTFVGEFYHTYKEESRIDRPLAEHEKRATTDLYEVDRHWYARDWTVEVETTYEYEFEDSETITNEDGTTTINYFCNIDYETRSYDITGQTPNTEVDLKVYSNNIVSDTYTSSDEGRTIVNDAFKDGEYKNSYSIKVPKAPSGVVNSFNGNGNSNGDCGYWSETVSDVIYTLDIQDNRNNGELKELYRLYEGDVLKIMPYDNEVYFNWERLTDWKQRMTISDDLTIYQEANVYDELDNTMSYIEAYIKNHEAYVPLQVVKDYTTFARTEGYYSDAIQNLDHTKELSSELESYRGRVQGLLNSNTWDIAFNRMNLSKTDGKNLLSDMILGLIQEERAMNDYTRKGFANIYAPEDDNFVETYNKTYRISVNGDEDERNSPYISIEYVSISLKELILKYNGDINKAIMAYHISPEAFDELEKSYSSTWAQRGEEEVLEIVQKYRDVKGINPSIAENVLSYVKTTEGQQDLANTNTKWYQEWLKKAKDFGKGVIDSVDKLADKMFGDLYTTKENRGILYVKSEFTHFDYQIILQRIIGLSRGEEMGLKGFEWELWDFFGANAGVGAGMLGSDLQSPDLSYFVDLIPDISNFVTPYPDPSPKLNSPYGWRYHPKTKQLKFHSGVDVGKPGGELIYAINDGKVISSGSRGGYGYAVEIRHELGDGTNDYITSLYAHMRTTPLVRIGDTVKAGQAIGETGSTGVSTGNHLHFEVRAYISPSNPNYSKWTPLISKEYFNTINPFPFVSSNPTPDQIAVYSRTSQIANVK